MAGDDPANCGWQPMPPTSLSMSLWWVGGPAGYMMAALLGRAQHSVALVDPKPEGAWPNNYGSWREEWESLAASLQMPELLDCVATHWAMTDCFFGGSFDMPDDERLRLDRAYLKVDRLKF